MMSRCRSGLTSTFLLLVALLVVVANVSADANGLDVNSLSGKSKKFFFDMTKQVMGVPSLKPEVFPAKKFNIDPASAFKMLSTFFQTFQKGASNELAQKGLKMAGKFLRGGSGGSLN